MDTLLRAATTDELVQALSYSLRFNERGKAHRMGADFVARIAAETLVKHLELAGFVVMKKPPGGAPVAPYPYR